ncbi:PASTA domain-containing protein [Bacillus alkalicellulosilyticus]|uniref:PASTA domain-containing protein n=1 Tax=Alkalihalobacterium alkalicellulosilyticum TaxID=1912214 RepID=UPI0009960090|nr:PASTA domain-containing protein [Bacillus alkalicellulosilyticus]
MSDFLSRFSKDNYEKQAEEQGQEQVKQEKTSVNEQSKGNEEEKKTTTPKETNQAIPTKKQPTATRRYESVEEVEIDPTYQAKKKRMIIYSAIGSLLALLLIIVIYYQAVHVDMEDFVGLPVSEARSWASENGLEIELTHETSSEVDANLIMTQSIPAGKNVRKGDTISFVSSTGPDPEELISLPDFEELSQYDAETWIADNKVENLQMVTEYNDEVEQGKFIKFVIRDSSIDESEYRRKDRAIVYYSRGQEVFEKNITVPDFSGKTRTEVEQWAETNEIDMKYEEEDSNNVEVDVVISQSISPEEKIAKRDKMKVVVSLGKAVVVPNFAEMTMEEAMSYAGLSVMVKQRFHAEVPYGGLISQSIKADTKLTDQDDTDIVVVYSEGRPYLRDYRGQLEGDLPRLFYEDYQSKGANIRYTVKYVDSPEVKGTVVSMSNFHEFVSMTYKVEMRISNNKYAATAPDAWDDDNVVELPSEEPDQEPK